jgi:hypothetical protein
LQPFALLAMYLRDIALDARYAQDLDGFRRQYPALDDVQAALEWELANKPTTGEPLDFAPDFRRYTTKASVNTPTFHILYSFDENKVYLHSIHPAES